MDGESRPIDELFALVYDHLRELAHRCFERTPASGTLQPTALVHEAFVKLVGIEAPPQDREHFLALSAKAMREILIDRARRRGADKRGGRWVRVTLSDVGDDSAASAERLLAIDDAMSKLAALDPRQARIVELRFFAGMTGQEIGSLLGISRNTVVRELAMARAWLLAELDRPPEERP